MEVRGRTQAHRGAVGGCGEGHVDVDADHVPSGALFIGERTRPVVRLFHEHLIRGALMESRQTGQERVPVGCFARGAVHGVVAERAGVVLAVPLAAWGRVHSPWWAGAAQSSAPGR